MLYGAGQVWPRVRGKVENEGKPVTMQHGGSGADMGSDVCPDVVTALSKGKENVSAVRRIWAIRILARLKIGLGASDKEKRNWVSPK